MDSICLGGSGLSVGLKYHIKVCRFLELYVWIYSPCICFNSLFADGRFLQIIDGANLSCAVKNHPALLPVMNLLPENVLVSGCEDIPGLAASPTGDALLRPQLLKMLPFTLNRLTISLQPSLEKFESQLLQLINADWTHKAVIIQERRLHVGVHNGWCFLDKPQVVVLEPLASGLRGRADGTSNVSTLLQRGARMSITLKIKKGTFYLKSPRFNNISSASPGSASFADRQVIESLSSKVSKKCVLLRNLEFSLGERSAKKKTCKLSILCVIFFPGLCNTPVFR
uniref:Uncharacterized protein n=1 Tax=Salarias fasciatus TaxID=181472 RepID=A0A672GQF0_SALFA